MKKLLVLVVLMACAFVSKAQSASPELPHEAALLKDANPGDPKEGTYQVVLADPRMVYPEITVGMKSLIASRRKQSEIEYIVIDAYTTIKVLPYNEINSASFKPVKTYVYEN